MKQMSISVKKATKKTNINHNNRTLTKSEMRNNQHIDLSRGHRNVYLVNEDIEKIYEQEFSQALEDYNSKQKRNDRKIDNYFEHISNSKKTSVQQEMIFQIGEQDQFENDEDRDVAVSVLKDYFDIFKHTNPQLKIYNAVIHDDEASPHLHINFVPVADGYKRGLEKQVSFDRAIKQQEPELYDSRPFEDWRERQVEIIEHSMNREGIERIEVGTNFIRNVNHFKAIKATERDLKEKESKLESVSSDLSDLEAQKQEIDDYIADLGGIAAKGRENAVDEIKSFQFEVKTSVFNKKTIQMPQDKFKEMSKNYVEYASTSSSYAKLNQSLEDENKKLKRTVSNQYQALEKMDQLEVENNSLRREYNHLQKIFDIFKPSIQKHHDFLQRALDKLPFFESDRNYLKGFVGGTLLDESLEQTTDIAVFASNHDYDTTLDEYGIGRTVEEHKVLEQEQELVQETSYDFEIEM